jgi:hypothetical protein
MKGRPKVPVVLRPDARLCSLAARPTAGRSPFLYGKFTTAAGPAEACAPESSTKKPEKPRIYAGGMGTDFRRTSVTFGLQAFHNFCRPDGPKK